MWWWWWWGRALDGRVRAVSLSLYDLGSGGMMMLFPADGGMGDSSRHDGMEDMNMKFNASSAIFRVSQTSTNRSGPGRWVGGALFVRYEWDCGERSVWIDLFLVIGGRSYCSG